MPRNNGFQKYLEMTVVFVQFMWLNQAMYLVAKCWFKKVVATVLLA